MGHHPHSHNSGYCTFELRLTNSVSFANALCYFQQKGAYSQHWGWVLQWLCFTITEVNYLMVGLFYNVAQPLVMVFVTPSSLAASMCLDPEIEQNRLFIPSMPEIEQKRIYIPPNAFRPVCLISHFQEKIFLHRYHGTVVP